jgi:cytochrome c oxidase subunit 2
MTRYVITLVLAVSATAAGGWARQVQNGVDEVTTIDIVASQYAFEPATISVAEGSRIRLRLRSIDRTHGIGIKAFRVKTVIPGTGEVATVEFVADRVGTFDITCSEYCGTRHAAMKGRLIVFAREKWWQSPGTDLKRPGGP